MVMDEMDRAGCDQGIAAGVVITGGTAILDGLVGVAERVFDAPVRIGTPVDIGGLVDAVNSPMYATAVGLVRHAHGHHHAGTMRPEGAWRLGRMRDRIAGWLRDFF
jgi:cell division protein FtsA